MPEHPEADKDPRGFWRRWVWPEGSTRRWRAYTRTAAVFAASAGLYGLLWPDDLSREDPWFVRAAWAAFVVRTFVFHLGLAAAAIGATALLLRAPWTGAIMGLVGAVLLWPALTGLFTRARPVDGQPTLTVMSINLLYGRADSARLAECIGQNRPDLILFQEYTPTTSRELSPLLGADYPYRFEHARDDAFGQAVYSRQPFISPPRAFPAGWNDPQVRAEVQFAGSTVILMNVHLLPPVNLAWVIAQRRETVKLAALAQKEIAGLPAAGALIVAGDFNATPESAHMAAMRRAGLREAHAEAGTGRGTTWPRTMPLRLAPGVRIDHVLYAGGLECVASGVCGDIGSDHRPIFARFVRKAVEP